MAETIINLKTAIGAIRCKYWVSTEVKAANVSFIDLSSEIQTVSEVLITLKLDIRAAFSVINDLNTEITILYPVRDKFLLLRYDHVPARNEQNVQIGKAMQFRLYNPDPAFGIDLTTFKIRFDSGAWYRYGDDRLTFTEISYREYKVYFNPPDFAYDSEITAELYCEDHLNNPGIKLEIL